MNWYNLPNPPMPTPRAMATFRTNECYWCGYPTAVQDAEGRYICDDHNPRRLSGMPCPYKRCPLCGEPRPCRACVRRRARLGTVTG